MLVSPAQLLAIAAANVNIDLHSPMKTLPAIIYSNNSQACDRAVCLFKSLELPYVEYLLGRDFTASEFTKEFGDDAEYPQVAVGIKHLGSLKDTLRYFGDKL